MSKSNAPRGGQPATDLLEEAIRLLRRAPAGVLLIYYVGSVPTMLAVLYFLADLSGSADADSRVFPASVGLAAAYLWMKCCHTVFAAGLRSFLLLEDAPRWTIGRLLRLLAAQAALQPTGLILRPLALVLTLPYVWTSNFYMSVTVLGDGEHGRLRDLCSRAYTQCRLWPLQAHVVASFLTVFGLFVWLNVLIAMMMVPMGLKMFLGVESMFSKHALGMINPTFFAASFAATYLCLDPIRKAVIVLRCFRGSSLQSGADLVVQLRAVRRAAARAATTAVAILLCFATLAPAPAHAALRQERKVKAEELSRSLDDVMERREYTWRAPRDRVVKDKASETWWDRMKRDLQKWFERTTWQIGHFFGKIWKKLQDWFSRDREESGEEKPNWMSSFGSVRVLFYVLLVAAAVLLIVMVARFRRRPKAEEAKAEPAVPRPDLSQEHVTADQLPEDEWLKLARDLMQSGEMRLALRASYLAGLAHLGHREFIRLARHKSNRDYELELRRRARTQPELIAAFDQNLASFERAWYGEHVVTRDTLGEFSTRLETIRAC